MKTYNQFLFEDNTEYKFKIGDQVKLNPDSAHKYKETSFSKQIPLGVVGEIIDKVNFLNWWYKVQWEENNKKYYQFYDEEDLIFSNPIEGNIEEWNETNEEYNYDNNKFEVGDKVILKDSCKDLGLSFYRKNPELFNIPGEIIDFLYNGNLKVFYHKDDILNIFYGERVKNGLIVKLKPTRYKLYYDIEDDIEEWDDDINEEHKHNNNKFEIGDRVRIKKVGLDLTPTNVDIKGEEGTIKNLYYDMCMIDFDNNIILKTRSNIYNNKSISDIAFRYTELELIEDEIEGDIEEWDDTNEEYDYENNKFEIGDRVRCISHSYSKKFNIHDIGEEDVITNIIDGNNIQFNKNSNYFLDHKRYELVDTIEGNIEEWDE